MTGTLDRLKQLSSGLRTDRLRTHEIEVGGYLNGHERDWLLGCLRARRGVKDASYRENAVAQILVEYDPCMISGDELAMFVGACSLADGALI